MERSDSRCVSIVCGIEASYIPDMLVQVIVIALGQGFTLT